MIAQKKWNDVLYNWRLWLPPVLLSVPLIIIAQYNYLSFHSLAELFAIVISFVIFALAWSTRNFTSNYFLLFLACGYFWVGSLDLMHTLVYKGMNIFVEGSGNLSVQFWICARYSEALLLLAAPFASTREQNGYLLITILGIISIGLTYLIFSGQFPTGYVEGKGLTDFKIYSEYLIILILIFALIALFRHGGRVTTTEKKLITASIVFTMGAELLFTFYVDVYGLSNLLGHIFKIFSFWFIFQAIVMTNLKKPYNDILKADKFLRLVLESTSAPLLISRLSDGIIRYANPATATMLGMSVDDVIGTKAANYYAVAKDRTKLRNALVKAGEINNYEVLIKKKNGSHFWAIVGARISEYEDEQYMISGIVDISQRRKEEDKLRTLSAAVEQTGNIIVITDSNGLIEYANPKFIEMSGYSLEEVLGQNPRMLKSSTTSDEEYENLWKTISSGKTWRGEFQNQAKDGTIYMVAATISPVMDDNLSITHFIAIEEDITERIELEMTLRQAHKMDAIGNLAGGIAHDVNNMLLPIISLSEMTMKDQPEGSRGRKRLEKVIEAGFKAKNLIAGILAFSHRDDGSIIKEEANIADVIQGTVDLLRSTLPSTITIIDHLDPHSGTVLCDTSQISTVLMNMGSNSADALENHVGEFNISVDPVDVTKQLANMVPNLIPGKFARITVSDTGKGMDSETLGKIFDPFFTTKPVGKGTGLGLAMSHGIIIKHNGAISVSSDVSVGTTFEIYLPLIEQDE